MGHACNRGYTSGNISHRMGLTHGTVRIWYVHYLMGCVSDSVYPRTTAQSASLHSVIPAIRSIYEQAAIKWRYLRRWCGRFLWVNDIFIPRTRDFSLRRCQVKGCTKMYVESAAHQLRLSCQRVEPPHYMRVSAVENVKGQKGSQSLTHLMEIKQKNCRNQSETVVKRSANKIRTHIQSKEKYPLSPTLKERLLLPSI